jgi:thioredoxin 1
MKQLTSQNFNSVDQIKNRPYMIKFSSPTCGPCNTMKPVLEALDQNNPDFQIFEVDTSVSPELAAHFGIRGVPTMLFCENREVLYSFTGVTPLRDMQYVIENINDEYFRETGQFKAGEGKKDNSFNLIIAGIIALFIGVLVFLSLNK